MTMFGLKQEHIEAICRCFAAIPAIREVVVYGSRAKETHKPGSDLDLTIIDDEISSSDLVRLDSALDDLMLPYKFDLSLKRKIRNPDLIDHIDRVGKVFYQRKADKCEWKEYRLQDIALINPVERISKGCMAKKITMDVLQPFTKKITSFSIEKYAGGTKFRNGDTVIARITPCLENGKTAYIDVLDENEIGFGSTEFIVLREKETNSDRQFLYYFAISPDFRDIAILSMTGSSGRQRVQTDVVKQHKFLLPPFPEQRAIASVLSSLDDKIDLLHRQNATLEKMAETLFRQWFVEEAKEEWEKKPLSSIATFLNGLACQKFPPKNGIDRLPVLKIKELGSGITENSDWATTEVNPEYIIKSGDVIFAWSASLMVRIWTGENCILNQHLFKVTSNNYPKWFYYFWCKYHLEEFSSIAASHATTMGHIKRGDLDNAMVLVPTNDEIKSMSAVMNPVIQKIIANSSQIRTGNFCIILLSLPILEI
jgi:type I restriction enzyme S subunit